MKYSFFTEKNIDKRTIDFWLRIELKPRTDRTVRLEAIVLSAIDLSDAVAEYAESISAGIVEELTPAIRALETSFILANVEALLDAKTSMGMTAKSLRVGNVRVRRVEETWLRALLPATRGPLTEIYTSQDGAPAYSITVARGKGILSDRRGSGQEIKSVDVLAGSLDAYIRALHDFVSAR